MRIANYKEISFAFGKTPKFVLWVQGCKHNCKKCIAKQWQNLEGGEEKSNEDLTKLIFQSKVEGVVLSGGEPLLQYEDILVLVNLLRKDNLGIILYTGFSKKDVEENYSEILDFIDVIISGQYIESKNNGRGLRGSTNQEIEFLTNRYLEEKDFFYNGNRILEIDIENEAISFCGIPPLDANILFQAGK